MKHSSTTITMQEATDRVRISELINSYSRFADRREPLQQADLFTDDATIEIYHSEPAGQKPDAILHGKKEFVAGFERLKQYEVTYHLNGQSDIHLSGDSATGEVHCLSHHVWTEDGKRMLMVMGIRYYDSYVRKLDAWLFANRKLIIDWTDKRTSTSE